MYSIYSTLPVDLLSYVFRYRGTVLNVSTKFSITIRLQHTATSMATTVPMSNEKEKLLKIYILAM